jgi:hypothetical protein
VKIFKRVLVLFALLFVALQFIRPPRNASEASPEHDITVGFTVPWDVQKVLRTSCYDCHSNSTRYPWYAEIQPVGWWLDGHIREARRELNFSEFAGYRPRRQFIKLEQIAEEVREDAMPLPSYLIVHTDARLSPQQKEILVAWTNAARNFLRESLPPDSLEGPRR